MEKSDRIHLVGTLVLCIAMTLLGIGFGEILIQRDVDHEESIVHDSLRSSGSLLVQDMQRKVAQAIFVTDTLHALLRLNNYEVDGFEGWGRQVVSINSSASTVQLAPGGVVSHIYPLSGNEKAMGHDLLKDSRRDDGAIKAMKSRDVTFVGPVKLVQNGKYAVIARKPIFRLGGAGEEFWGFAIALLLVEDILPVQIHELKTQGVSIRLEGDDPDAMGRPVLFESAMMNDDHVITMPITVPNGKWLLTLGHAPIVNHFYDLLRLFLYTASILMSFWVFVQQYMMRVKQREILRLNERLTELSMSDDLTGAGNRRAGMQLLEHQIHQAQRYGQPLSVAMIDLDYFKEVNDEYGHPAGDLFLQHVTDCFRQSFRKSDAVFRLGGDEFMMVFPQTGLVDCRRALEGMVEFTRARPCRLDAEELQISLSIGAASYQADESMEEFLRRVDERLYEAKDAGRNTLRY